jgi:hypothetical protein
MKYDSHVRFPSFLKILNKLLEKVELDRSNNNGNDPDHLIKYLLKIKSLHSRTISRYIVRSKKMFGRPFCFPIGNSS